MRASPSVPQNTLLVFRPGARVALLALVPPALMGIEVAGVAYMTQQRMPDWLPLALLAWLIVLIPLWLSLKTVRVTNQGIATGRPLRAVTEIPWVTVTQVRERHNRIYITAADGAQLSFTPWLLHDARGLSEALVLRLPPQVFTPRIGLENSLLSRRGVMPPVISGARFQARPNALLRAAVILAGAILLAGGLLGMAAFPLVSGIAVATACGILAIAAFALALWLTQRVAVDEQGILLKPFPFGPEREVRWSHMALLEHSPGERLIRVQNGATLLCAGPRLFSRRDRVLYQALLLAYTQERHVLSIPRSWLMMLRQGRTVLPPSASGWREPLFGPQRGRTTRDLGPAPDASAVSIVTPAAAQDPLPGSSDEGALPPGDADLGEASPRAEEDHVSQP